MAAGHPPLSNNRAFTSGVIWSTNELNQSGDEILQVGSGLIGILVLIAAVVLTFTGRYPEVCSIW